MFRNLKKIAEKLKLSICVGSLFIFIICSNDSSNPVTEDPPENVWLAASEQVSGTLTNIDGIDVLKLWGTNAEQGYAHGYLLGPEIIELINNIIETEYEGMTASNYENQLIPDTDNLILQQQYSTELQSVLIGINARAGGQAIIPILNRNLQYEDLLVINSAGELWQMNCSSFAAWDTLTEDGNTIAGRNTDFSIPASIDLLKFFLIVRIPPEAENTNANVSIATAGQIGGSTFMNTDGVAFATHDSQGLPFTVNDDIYPQYLIYREVAENAKPGTVIHDTETILRSRQTNYSQNMFVCFPSSEASIGSAVFEYDGAINVGNGVTCRIPDETQSFIICTNHFRERKEPMDCSRYDTLQQRMEEIANSNGLVYLTVEKAWDMLSEVPIDGMLLYHSVVFEPDKKIIHIAFTENGQHAVNCSKVTFDLTELISMPHQ